MVLSDQVFSDFRKDGATPGLVPGPAGSGANQEKHDRVDQEQRGDQGEQPPEQVGAHWKTSARGLHLMADQKSTVGGAPLPRSRPAHRLPNAPRSQRRGARRIPRSGYAGDLSATAYASSSR